MSAFKVSVWSKSKDQRSKPLGKSYQLKNGKLIHESVGTNAGHIQVVEVESLDDLIWIMEFDLHDGNGFITSGVPKKTAVKEAEVTFKDSPRKGCLSRSQSDIEWRAGTGTYFIIDYDPAWSLDKPKTAKTIRQELIAALELSGTDISELQILAYKSSSSGFIRSFDNHSFDKGGRHLIFLVEDAGDLERFEKVFFVFATLAGLSYGAVSNAGHFLERGIIDRAAVSPTQPTFAGVPAYREKGLTNVRETGCAHRLGGSKLALDTKTVRDPTGAEMVEYDRFWEKERSRLQPDITRKKREWLAKHGKDLAKQMPDVSPEQVRAILEHRWSGNLVGSDVIILNGRKVTISNILTNPDKYDGKTGPDPIEPGYRRGAQTCRVFMNRSNGQPMIFSQAHGGIRYRLWYDAQSAVEYLRSKAEHEALASIQTVLTATRVTNSVEAESLLLDLAKTVNSTKKELSKNYRKLLIENMRAVSPITEHLDHAKLSESTHINDVAHIAAEMLILDEQSIHTDDDRVWRFNGKHHESVSDIYLGGKLRKILSMRGWEDDFGLTRTTAEARTALKELTYAPTPLNALEPKKILNFQNGELHFLPNGKIKFKDHNPASQLTSVLSVDYDPEAEAPVFRRTLEELFFPPAQERMKQRSKSECQVFERRYLENAVIMADHVEELLAYFLVPDRWIAAWFLWIGGGSNGKTFLTKLLSLLLDDDAIESDRIQAFSGSDFGMERLIGKTIIIDDDLETGTKIPDGFVKKVSETKLLSANRKNKTSFTFKNRCALLLLTNNYPRFTDVSPGFRRRVHSLDFPRRFFSRTEIEGMSGGPQKEYAEYDLADTQLIDKIETELSGVVNALVRAYQRLIKRGGFLLPKDVRRSNSKLFREGNPLPMFIETQCVLGSKFRYRTSKFLEDLAHWLDSENNDWMPQNKQVRTMMDQLGWDVVKNNGIDHYVGIELKPITPDDGRNADNQDDEDWDDWDDVD